MSKHQNVPFQIQDTTVGLLRDGDAILIENTPGPPTRVDGLTICGPVMTGPAPHNGELHPDGDELLIVVSGRTTVHLEDGDDERAVEVTSGQGLIVPKGVWHRVVPEEPSQLIAVTPGPRGEWRPLHPEA